ncbi:heparin-binding hemagglutinin [Gordonia hydrophobica]|uniref:Heparin-binding hemagglutinin n=1 Tax=Gordonia hydrophobica TaxID=40516 RepID=A0ABZ2U3Y5_9ACTN|nr:heparin-binding hemagglutinin [Gordonia hydrophobica]MBM7368004.1 heparin binding hemagglutinin HbhA [Gordonia hydrophobica]
MSTAERTFPTPVYAVVGAGDVAVQEVKDAFAELKNRAQTSRERTQTRLDETRTRLAELPTEFPSVEDLRAKLTSDELRKVAEPYIEATTGLYNSLAERGESAVERLRQAPYVEENLARVEKAYTDAVELTEDALGAVSTQTRELGERAAALAGRTADKVEDAAVAADEVSSKLQDKAADIEKAGAKAKADADTAATKVTAARKPAAKKAAPAAKKAAPAAKKAAPTAKKAAPTAK